MASLAELRKKYPDLYQDMGDADMVYTLANAMERSPVRVAYDMGLDPSGYVQNEGTGEDFGTSLNLGFQQALRGAANLPNVVSGLVANTNLYETPGLDNEVRRLEGNFSQGYHDTQKEIGNAWDEGRYGDYALGLATNPSYTGNQVVQSLPSVVGGGIYGAGFRGIAALGALGRGALAAGVGRAAPFLGEGTVMTGEGYKNLLEADVAPREAAVTALGIGAGGAAIAGLGGAAANRMGVVDPERFLAGMGRRMGDDTVPMSYPAQIGVGMGIEAGEEALQSPWEQSLSNVAQDKPWDQGLARTAIEGGLAGGILGGGFNALTPPLRRISPDQPTDLLQDPQAPPPPPPPGVNPPGSNAPSIDPAAAARQRQIDAMMGGDSQQTVLPGQQDPGSLQGLTREQINQRLIDAAMGDETSRTFAPGQYPSDVAADLSQQQSQLNTVRAAEQAQQVVERQYAKDGWTKTPEKIALLEAGNAPKLASGVYGKDARKFVDGVMVMDVQQTRDTLAALQSKASPTSVWKGAVVTAHLKNLAQQEGDTLARQAQQNATIDGPGVAVPTSQVAPNGQPTEGVVAPTVTTSSVAQDIQAAPPPAPPGVVAPAAPPVSSLDAPTQALLDRANAKQPLENFELVELVDSLGPRVLTEDFGKTTSSWVKPREGETPEQTQARRDNLFTRVINLVHKRRGMGPFEGSSTVSLDDLAFDFVERDEQGAPIKRDGKYVSLFDSARSASGTYSHQSLSNIIDKLEGALRARGVPLPDVPKQTNKANKVAAANPTQKAKTVAPGKVTSEARRTALRLALQSPAMKAKLDALAKPDQRQDFENLLVEALNQRYGPTPHGNPKSAGLGLLGKYQQPRTAAAHVDTFNELDQMLRADPVFQTTFQQASGVDFAQLDIPAPGQTRQGPRFGASQMVEEGGSYDETAVVQEDGAPTLSDGSSEDVQLITDSGQRFGTVARAETPDAELDYDDNFEGEQDETGAPAKGGGAVGVRASANTYRLWAKMGGYLPDVAPGTDPKAEEQPIARAKAELNALPKNLKQTWIAATSGVRLKGMTANQVTTLQDLAQELRASVVPGAATLRGIDPGEASTGPGVSVKARAWEIGTRGMKNAPALADLDAEAQENFETLYEHVLRLPDATRESLLKKHVPAIVEDHNARTRTESAVEGAADAAGRPGGDAVASEQVAAETGTGDGRGHAGDTDGTGLGTAVAENRNASAAERAAERARKVADRKRQAAEADSTTRQGQAAAAENPTTEGALRAEIKRLLGTDRHWRLHIYANVDEAIAAGHAPRKIGNAYGWVDTNDKGVKEAFFIVDRIEAGTELASFLHEVGAHIGMSNLIPPQHYKNLVNQLRKWAAQEGNAQETVLAKAALARIEAAQAARNKAGHGTMGQTEQDDELVAYFLEEAVKAGLDPSAITAQTALGRWFRTLWATFKIALRKLRMQNIDSLTGQNVVDLAYGAARLDINTKWHGTDSKFRRVARAPEGDTSPDNIRYGFAGPKASDVKSHIAAAQDGVLNAMSDTYTSSKRGLLGWMGINQMVERYGDTLPVLKDIDKSFREMSRQAKVWLDRGDQIERLWSMLTPKQLALTNDIAGQATLLRFDPSKDKADTPEKQAVAQQWQALKALDAANPKAKGTTVILAAVKHYRDVMAESLAYLNTVKQEAAAAGASTHAIESLEKTIKALKKKQTYFWLPLHRFGDFYSVAMSPTLYNLAQRRKQYLDAVSRHAHTLPVWDEKADEKLYRKLRQDPQHYENRGFESERAARRHAEQLKAKGWHATSSVQKFTSDQARAHLKPELEAFNKMLANHKVKPAVANKLVDAYTDLLIEALPDGHALKHQLDREGIAGWDPDMKRAFAKTAQAQAFAASRLLHSRGLSEQLDQLKQQGASFEPHAALATDLYNELGLQQELATTRSEDPFVVRFATGFNYMAMLGASPFFWALQLAQVPTITFPYLVGRNKSNVSDTFRKLTTAWKQATQYVTWKTEANEWRAELDFAKAVPNVSKDELQALKDLDDSGRFVFTIGQDLGAAAEGRNTKTAKLLRSLNAPTQATELINRVSTGLAAYRISQSNQAGLTQRQGETATDFAKRVHDAAVEFAIHAVDNTQVNMDPVMGARNLKTVFGHSGQLSRSAARIIFQFWKFQQGMAYTTLTTMKDAWMHPDPALRKQARDTAIGLTASLMLTSGAFGLPFAGTGMMLLSALFSLDGDDDEDDDAERMTKNWISEHFPKPVADAMNRGIIWGLLPTDAAPFASPRFSMGNLMNPLGYARFDASDRGEDVVQELLFRTLGGPTGSSAAALWDGAQAALDGDFVKATEKAVPLKLVRDLARAYTLASDGVATGAGEQRINPNDLSAMSWVWQSMGVTPMKKGLYHEGQAAVQTLKSAVSGEREKLLAKHAQSRIQGGDVSAVTMDIMRFNQRHPEVRIKADNLRQAFSRRRDNQRKLTDTGILADKQNRPYLGNAAWTR